MADSARRDDPRWEAAADEHRIALATYLEAADRVPPAAWSLPRAPGKWSPAQITEHLALAYEAGIRELGGGAPMASRAPAWRQKLLRWVVLPHILFHRSFPLRAPSPREIRPGETSAPDRRVALGRLRELAERFEHELDRARRAGGGHLTHPYFGTVPPLKGMRFFAVHLDHHRAQVEEATASAATASSAAAAAGEGARGGR